MDALIDPDDLIEALDAAHALDWWQTAAPSYRRNILRWIVQAKRVETRAKRIGIVVTHAAKGEKVAQF
ncbi:MAG: YdeI/OmpD-associated family protein [Paracoccaceae bacterium]